MRFTKFVFNFSLLIICTKSLENLTISNSSSTTTSTVKSSNITVFENSNIKKTTMTHAQLLVDVLLDPNFISARAIRNSEAVFPSRARKNNVEKINTNPRKKRYFDCRFLESDIIPHFLYDRPKRRNDEIRRPHFKLYPVFSGK